MVGECEDARDMVSGKLARDVALGDGAREVTLDDKAEHGACGDGARLVGFFEETRDLVDDVTCLLPIKYSPP